MTDFTPGLFRDLPSASYHAIEAMSASGAKKMIRSPQHFIVARTKPSAPSAAMEFGTAVHAGVLEPETFNEAVVVAPEINKRTKDGKAEWEAFAAANAGRVVLAPEDWERCAQTIAAVRKHPAAAQLLNGGERELSLFWRDGKYGVPCKSRFDAFNHNIVIDLKTCQDASPETFARTIAQYLYHLQAAFYFSGAEHVLNATPAAFAFIAVETEPPFAVACYVLPANGILAGAHLANIALERYATALATGEWPGYSDTIEAIKLPKWATTFNV